MGRLHIDGAAEVKAAALLYQRAPREIQAGIRREAQAWAPTLKQAAMKHARTDLDRAIAASGKLTVTSKGLRAVFGSAPYTPTPRGRAKARTIQLMDVARAWEFGTGRPDEWSGSYWMRQRTTRRAVKVEQRRTQRQVPRRKDTGRFAYPAVADTTPDLVGRWVRVIAEAVTYG